MINKERVVCWEDSPVQCVAQVNFFFLAFSKGLPGDVVNKRGGECEAPSPFYMEYGKQLCDRDQFFWFYFAN